MNTRQSAAHPHVGAVEPDVPGGGCLFNRDGFFVSGRGLLRCERRGVRVREGEWRPHVGAAV